MKKLRLFVLLSITGIFLAKYSFAEKYKYGSNNNKKSENATTAGCSNATTSTDLDLNNVRAMIHTGGDMWWDLVRLPKYEVPKGSGKNSLFAGAIWIGGTDVNGQLRICALRFRQQGEDYWPGPLINRNGSTKGSVTSDVCAKFDKHFVVTKTDVSQFRSYINTPQAKRDSLFPGYSIPDIIKNWPANGDVVDGYDVHLAPYFDADQDGYYDCLKGDYPYYDLDGVLPCGTNLRIERLYGDKTLWWVYNDEGNIHTESQGKAIGMELRAQAFAFSTNDELNNMTFYNYRIVNRSTFTLENTYFGVWTDADLGYAGDDYCGCDVARGLGYVYNGANCDQDGNGNTYGCQPPACGIDFFEGPYQDNDGLDNLSSWSPSGTLDCANGYGRRNANGEPDRNAAYTNQGISGDNGKQSHFVTNGNINGLNFGDGTIDNERWGMRRFIYFLNAQGAMGDPTIAYQYYNYLRGYWSDGTRMTYGGSGHLSSSIYADFMYPDVTDPCGWGTGGAPQSVWSMSAPVTQTPADVRFVQSAGPFTLEPGATNDITVGAVWARATSGGPWGSVIAMQTADDKAQKLFENCFKVVDGPDAPELNIIELDKTLVFHIYNNKGSNNYKNVPEDYSEEDPFIVCPTSLPTCNQYYKFEGYQVFQLVDASTSVTDITDPDKARIVFQCDIKNGVGQIINYIYNVQLGASVPTDMVDGADNGIQHSFTLINDEFATGDKRLVNFKTYYFVAIAYAYNNFKTYNPSDALSLDGQKLPYLSGRKGAEGSIKTYAVIPHNPTTRNSGTVLNSNYGDCPKITQIEGHGCGENSLDITQKTINKIMSGFPWKADSVEYESGKGPFIVKVVDPLNVIADDFILKFIPDSTPVKLKSTPGIDSYIGTINLGRWAVYKKSDEFNPVNWIWSSSQVTTSSSETEQLILPWGISIDLTQVPHIGDGLNSNKNGFIEASIDFSDISKPWLEFFPDADDCSAMNWIRSGKNNVGFDPPCDDYFGMDDDKNFSQISLNPYAGISGGTWAPYNLVSRDINQPYGTPNVTTYQHYGIAFSTEQSKITFSDYRFPSVDLIITSDKSKWSRSPVVEMREYSFDTIHHTFSPGMSEGNQLKFCLRKHASIDKNGNYATTTNASIDPDSANYIGATGMGWFPGYAIDIETGERLNIVYGEDSKFAGENGRDMIWNPTSNPVTDLYYETGGYSGEVLFGGKHYIYIFGHSIVDTSYAVNKPLYLPNYDAGKKFHDQIINSNNITDNNLKSAWKSAVWTAIPMLNPAFQSYDHSNPYGFIQSDVKIRLRVANPFSKSIYTLAKDSLHTLNNNFPMYFFSTKGMNATTNNSAVAKNALDMIRAVPNPYYGYNSYETSQVDNRVKFINLPQKCTISIYNVSGTLVRRYQKDSPESYQDWDIKNEYGITVASGVYIIHINAPGIGEKIVKWFGALRPIDLNSF